MRLIGLALFGLAALALPASAAAQAPVASFTYSPVSPLTGQLVSFSSTSTGMITSLAWDLDGDDACDDAPGRPPRARSPPPGATRVSLCVNVDAAMQKQTIAVRNRPPVAPFSFSPASPAPTGDGDAHLHLGGPRRADRAQAWDLDGDGQYDDSGYVAAGIALGRASHTVGLRVLDRDGAAARLPADRGRARSRPSCSARSRSCGSACAPRRAALRVSLLGVRGPEGMAVLRALPRPRLPLAAASRWRPPKAACASGAFSAGCAPGRCSSCWPRAPGRSASTRASGQARAGARASGRLPAAPAAPAAGPAQRLTRISRASMARRACRCSRRRRAC